MKCALCGKDVRQHKRVLVKVVNSGILGVEPSTVSHPMHNQCAKHYKVTERLLISTGVVKEMEKKPKVMLVSAPDHIRGSQVHWTITDEYYLKDTQPKYNIFGKRREW